MGQWDRPQNPGISLHISLQPIFTSVSRNMSWGRMVASVSSAEVIGYPYMKRKENASDTHLILHKKMIKTEV